MLKFFLTGSNGIKMQIYLHIYVAINFNILIINVYNIIYYDNIKSIKIFYSYKK